MIQRATIKYAKASVQSISAKCARHQCRACRASVHSVQSITAKPQSISPHCYIAHCCVPSIVTRHRSWLHQFSNLQTTAGRYGHVDFTWLATGSIQVVTHAQALPFTSLRMNGVSGSRKVVVGFVLLLSLTAVQVAVVVYVVWAQITQASSYWRMLQVCACKHSVTSMQMLLLMRHHLTHTTQCIKLNIAPIHAGLTPSVRLQQPHRAYTLCL